MTPACHECDEDDPDVLVACRDGVTRCAHHTMLAGICWDCGDGDAVRCADDWLDGLCHDCRAADEMARRNRKRWGLPI